MKNFTTTKSLCECRPGELSIGTALEVMLDGVAARRGVVLSFLDEKPMMWWALKSASVTDLFSIDADFAAPEVARLQLRPVGRYEDFVKRLPAAVRQKAGGIVGKRAQAKNSNTAKKSSAEDERMHQDLYVAPAVPGTVNGGVGTRPGAILAAWMRPGDVSPGCSPPPTPKKEKRTLTTEVVELTDAVTELTATVSSMQRAIKKLKKRVRTTEAERPLRVSRDTASAFNASPWT